MEPTLRPGRESDARICGGILFNAFTAISRRHSFAPDFPSVEVAVGLLTHVLSRPDVHSVIDEAGGRIIGSNFLWEGGAIAGVGPVTIDPAVQDGGVGRRLMEAVLARAGERKLAGVRLVQAGFTTARTRSTRSWASRSASRWPTSRARR